MNKFYQLLKSHSKLLFVVAAVIMSGLATAWTPTDAAAPASNAPTGAQANPYIVVNEAYSVFIHRVGTEREVNINVANYKRMEYNPHTLAVHFISSPTGKKRNATVSNAQFVQKLYEEFYYQSPSLASAGASTYAKALASGITRPQLFEYFVRYSNKASRPSIYTVYPREKVCAGFTRSSTVKPLCKPNSRGTVNDVIVAPVPGTNIVVNKAIVQNVANLRAAALKKGYNLQATPSSNKKFPTNGSYRTPAAQAWLRAKGYPAAKGVSNHQWGLAIDFRCNGRSLVSNRGCFNWMKANAGKYGFKNYIIRAEPWHWSTTGR